MKITELQLRNIKCFEEARLLFGEKDKIKNWSLIVGDNGQGKTTILRSLAVGLCDEEGASALLAELHGGILSHGKKEGYIKVSLEGTESPSKSYTIEKVITLKGKNESITQEKCLPDEEEPFAVAYGSDRSITGTESYEEYSLVDSLYSLFNYKYQLQNAELGARRIKDHAPEIWENFQDILKDILMLLPEDRITLEPQGLYITSKWGKVSFNALSDGYRSFASVILDFLSWNMLKVEKFNLNNISGIFLIDEIEEHLHPRWQRDIIKTLANKFPNVQFICSTHTPICALGLNDLDGESQLIKVAYENGHSCLESFDPKKHFRGYRADQVLTSDLFGLSDTRNLTIEEKLETYRKIYLKPEEERDRHDNRKFKKIKNELEGLPMWENEMDRQDRKELIKLLRKNND